MIDSLQYIPEPGRWVEQWAHSSYQFVVRLSWEWSLFVKKIQITIKGMLVI